MKFYLVLLYKIIEPDGITNAVSLIVAASSQNEAIGNMWEDWPKHRVEKITDCTNFILGAIEEHDIQNS